MAVQDTTIREKAVYLRDSLETLSQNIFAGMFDLNAELFGAAPTEAPSQPSINGVSVNDILSSCEESLNRLRNALDLLTKTRAGIVSSTTGGPATREASYARR